MLEVDPKLARLVSDGDLRAVHHRSCSGDAANGVHQLAQLGVEAVKVLVSKGTGGDRLSCSKKQPQQER